MQGDTNALSGDVEKYITNVDHVELNRRAVSDVDEILGWLGVRSPQGAASWHDVWREVLDRLGE